MCRRTRYFLQKLAKIGNILIKQTAQALIRLRRYLGMQSQLTMRAIVAFFLDVAQQKHVAWAMTQKTVLAKTNGAFVQYLSTFKEGILTLVKSSYIPSCKTGISYTSENGGKPCRACKNIRIFNGCELLKIRSQGTVRHHKACWEMPNSYPEWQNFLSAPNNHYSLFVANPSFDSFT